MKSSPPRRIDQSRPVRRARRGRWAQRFRPARRLTVTTLAAGTCVAALAPVTAAAGASERRLGNAVLLTHDGYGHISQADPSTCVMQALGRYFTGLTTPALGTICPSDHGPFDPGFGQAAPSR